MDLSALDEARHRLLEGFVLRLARRPESDAFALRGGMRVRQWFPAAGRPALDLDLVCSLPFELPELRRILGGVLGETGVSDGVRFQADRFRLDPIWTETAAPGLRLFALGRVDGVPTDLRVDVTFGLSLWPEPELELFQGQRGSARVWMCRPESLLGRKLQVITGLGHRHWRPKDLHDVRMVLDRFDLEPGTLGEALEASLVGCAESMADVREAFTTDAWWEGPRAYGRWHRYLQDAGVAAPVDLASVVAEVRSHLRPLLGDR